MNEAISYRQQAAAARRHRGWWLLGGFLLQAIGAGGVAAFLWIKVSHEDLGGHITKRKQRHDARAAASGGPPGQG